MIVCKEEDQPACFIKKQRKLFKNEIKSHLPISRLLSLSANEGHLLTTHKGTFCIISL